MANSLKEDQGDSITQNEGSNLKGWTDKNITNSENGSDEPMSFNLPRLFQNEMLISKILSYLSQQDLIGCRLLCKVWNSEASRILGKRITLALDFRYPYYLPSPPVFQGLSQIGRKLAIQLPEHVNRFQLFRRPQSESPPHNLVGGEGWKLKPWEKRPTHPKMITELTKLLSFPNNFTSLFLNITLSNSTEVSILLLILEKVSKTLKTLSVEIHSHFSHFLPLCPPITPTFTLPSLTTFSNFSPTKCDDEDDWEFLGIEKLWDTAALFSSLFTEKVEKFLFNSDQFRYYFQHFLKTGKVPKMKELYLKEVSDHDFRHFLEVEVSIKSLEISCLYMSETKENLTEQIFQKVAGNLERLVLSLGCNFVLAEINVSVFPKLKELSLTYGSRTEKIVWEKLDGRVEYSKLFPVLSSLSVFPPQKYRPHFSKKNGRFNEEGNCQGVFDCFFPENSTQVCESVTELKIPMLTTEEGLSGDYTLYEERLRTIAKMFPNASNAGWKELRDFN